MRVLDWIWCWGVVRIPPYRKEIKVSRKAEDDARSVEVGTHETGHQSDLSGEQSYAQVGKFWKTKCDITLRLV